MTKTTTEALSALRTVHAFNAQPQEREKFHQRVNNILSLVQKEAKATAIFFGSTGWSGNVTLLALLGYGTISRLYNICLSGVSGGSLVSQGIISVGDLTSLLLYTVYVGSGLQMLTLVPSFVPSQCLDF